MTMPWSGARRFGRRLSRVWRWTAADRRLFVEAVQHACRVEVALRRRASARTLAGLNADPLIDAARPSPASVIDIQTAIRRAYTVLPFEPTCLRESLVFCRMCMRRDVGVHLRIGVKIADRRLHVHAWVEDAGGIPLTDPLDNFAPFPLSRMQALTILSGKP